MSAKTLPLSRQAYGALASGVDSPVRSGYAVGGSPPTIASARGSRVFDVGGREYIDYLCAYGPIILGHADRRITAAVGQALEGGAVFGATHPQEVRLAERIRSMMPSMERVRFVSTGTESCMSAVRLARAFTAREKVVRFAGNYHGQSDDMIFSAGASSNTNAPADGGVSARVAADVVVLPYNDLDVLHRALALEADRVAAVILEPIVGNMGLVMPAAGYLAAIRAMCDRVGVLLIFDEVITGFRVGVGGAQAKYGVRPDLTCIGKALGGGLPIAAFGGRADIMARLAPTGPVFQGGTFSGNPVCVAAAHAFLDVLESENGFYERLEARTQRLAAGIQRAVRDAGHSYAVVQVASMMDFMFRDGPPHKNHAEAASADAAAYARYYWAMLERGIHLPPSQMEVMFVTDAHTDEDVDATIGAIREALEGA